MNSVYFISARNEDKFNRIPDKYLYQCIAPDHGSYFVTASDPTEAGDIVKKILENFRNRPEIITITQLGGRVIVGGEPIDAYGKLI